MDKPTRNPNNQLWEARKKLGYSQAVVAKLLGHKTYTHISDYECGTRIPSLKTALKLEVALCTPIAFLYPSLYNEVKKEINAKRDKLTKADRSN